MEVWFSPAHAAPAKRIARLSKSCAEEGLGLLFKVLNKPICFQSGAGLGSAVPLGWITGGLEWPHVISARDGFHARLCVRLSAPLGVGMG
jgi:hypothetical protein